VRATAALLESAGAPFTLKELDLEEPRPDEVLVRVSSVGICGTDLEFAKFFPTPAVLGHEGAGIVERVGSRVTSIKPGDHVAMSFASCGTCSLCLTGSPAYCRQFDAVNFTGTRPDGTTALSIDGAAVNGHFLGQSSFASHVVAPARAVVPIDPSIDLRHVGPFGCGFQTGAGGILNVLRPEPAIIAVDVNEDKLTAARGYGATHAVNSTATDVAKALVEIAPGGLNYAIDTTGREDVLRTAVEALGPLGRAGVIGVGPSESMSFEWRSILNGRSVTGIIAGSSLPQVFLPKLLDLHAAGRFPVDRMITYLPFEQINEAVAAVKRGDASKAVLTF
jgi:aryl-alcohol dehydrogenase